jgi:hypothetical protein
VHQWVEQLIIMVNTTCIMLKYTNTQYCCYIILNQGIWSQTGPSIYIYRLTVITTYQLFLIDYSPIRKASERRPCRRSGVSHPDRSDHCHIVMVQLQKSQRKVIVNELRENNVPIYCSSDAALFHITGWFHTLLTYINPQV